MKARICNLHKTEAGWEKLNTWVPAAGEFVIYDPDDNHLYSRVKVGDGKTPICELAFFATSAAMSLIQKQHYFDIIDAGRVTDYN